MALAIQGVHVTRAAAKVKAHVQLDIPALWSQFIRGILCVRKPRHATRIHVTMVYVITRVGVIQKLNDLIFKKWRQIFFEKNPKTQRFEKTQRFDIRDPDYHRIQLLMLKVNSSSPFYGGPDKLSAPRII